MLEKAAGDSKVKKLINKKGNGRGRKPKNDKLKDKKAPQEPNEEKAEKSETKEEGEGNTGVKEDDPALKLMWDGVVSRWQVYI